MDLDSKSDRVWGWGFQTTHWSIVAAAGRESHPGNRDAFGSLYEAYTAPLLAFLRARGGCAGQEPEDIVQGFFASLIAKNRLEGVDRNRGKFRNWLLTSLRHYLANERDKTKALKRGGDTDIVSLEEEHEDGRPKHAPASAGRTPEQEYDHAFALQFLSQVKSCLRCEFVMKGKTSLFERLDPFLIERNDEVSQSQAAQDAGMSPDAFHHAVHRMRLRYRAIFDRELRRLIGEEGDLDEEKIYLLNALTL